MSDNELVLRISLFSRILRDEMDDFIAAHGSSLTSFESPEVLDFLSRRLEKIEYMRKQLIDMTDIGHSEYPQDDSYEEGVIDHIDPYKDGWIIRLWQGNSFYLSNEISKGIIPKPGILARFYPGTWEDAEPYGLYLDGQEIFYKPINTCTKD